MENLKIDGAKIYALDGVCIKYDGRLYRLPSNAITDMLQFFILEEVPPIRWIDTPHIKDWKTIKKEQKKNVNAKNRTKAR